MMITLNSVRIGTASWTIPASSKADFNEQGSHLERYAGRLRAVEVNSSFYKSHQFKTWDRWRLSTPDDFAYSAKLPKTITHISRLQNCDALVSQFKSEVMGLGPKLKTLLIQLPPSLKFDFQISESFFAMVTSAFSIPLVLEPRHITWFTDEAASLLKHLQICRASVDPPITGNIDPGQPSPDIAYFRLHGSPKTYYSDYSADSLTSLSHHIQAAAIDAKEIWCIFDNTAEGHATSNALYMERLFTGHDSCSSVVTDTP